MPKFFVSIPVGCSIGGEVEAETAEQAIEKACSEFYPSICHQCSDSIELGDMVCDEAHAEPLD